MDTATVHLSQGSEYVYGYRSFTHLKDIALVKVAAEFSVIPLSKQGGLQRCLLKVHKYDVIINKDGRDYLPEHDDVPLSDCTPSPYLVAMTWWHVTSFKYLGAIIADEESKPEILARIAQATAAPAKLKTIWNDMNIAPAQRSD
ncbi:hypothetical protein NP493_715g02001 [Ridgeia piscesae]|uniref:Uncharacterized protein n=1 Tax=Ridgeia piscesae TaxID=27915 RepID=A0AAD9KQK0_RIDPI|nr:hypothetical protein NP493_715g02001 [Ridgeia piscesae]